MRIEKSKNIFIKLSILLFKMFLVLCILISSIIFLVSTVKAGTYSGWHYKNIYNGKSPDGESKIDILIRQTNNDGILIQHESWEIIKIVVSDAENGDIIAEHESSCLYLNSYEPVVVWGDSNVTIKLMYKDEIRTEIMFDYISNSAISQEKLSIYYIRLMMISGFILILFVICLEIFISALYRSYCRKKYIEQPQPENSEQPDRESKV